MFLHNQPRFLAKLQGDVVPRDKKVLPANSGPIGRMQKRFAVHVSGRDLSQLLSRSQSFCKVNYFFQEVLEKREIRKLKSIYNRSFLKN